MREALLRGFDDVSAALRNPDLAQSMYDAGAVVMDKVLLTLHGHEHKARRLLELRVFRRNFLAYYEKEIFPAALRAILAPYLACGRADLVEFGHRVTINLAADFAGIDRPTGRLEETERLYELVKAFSEGATLVHSTRDPAEVEAEVREALGCLKEQFLRPSIERRRSLLARCDRGELSDDDLPRDVLTVLLRGEDRLPLPADVLLREMAFFLQAGSHSTANAVTHAMHEIFTWCGKHPGHRRLTRDRLFVQRCVHESLRLHPASPVAWRRPMRELALSSGEVVNCDDRVVIDLAAANRDRRIFGEDADEFNPEREIPAGRLPFGLTFGTGVHACLGRDLDGGSVARGTVDPVGYQYGLVTLLVAELLDAGARPHRSEAARTDPGTQRLNWGSYPVEFLR